jgi:hypothetical protein
MRRTIFLAAVLFATAPAQAATLPSASEPGIAVTRDSGGGYVLTFTAAAYRPIAGRRVSIACTDSAGRLPAASPPKRFVSSLSVPTRRAPIRLRPAAGTDVCAFASSHADFLVALDAGARRFLADYKAAVGVEEAVVLAATAGRTHASWPSYDTLPRRFRQEVAQLATPGAHPSGKAFGYYSDGRRRMAVAGISATGARLSFSISGEDATTNILGVTNVLDDPSAPSGTLPVGAFPPAGTPLPDATVPGVTATQAGREVDVAFSGADAEAAYRRLAGQRVAAVCTKTEQPVLGLVLQNATATFTLTAPDQPTTLRLDLGTGAYSTCSLAVAAGAPVVQVAVGEAGRAPLEDGLTSQALQAVSRRAAGDGTGGYASASSVSGAFSGAVVALGAPGDTPSDRRVGVFSDGRTHLAVVARTLTGRRLYADFSGSVLRTNLLSVMDLIPFG